MIDLLNVYHKDIPDFLKDIIDAYELVRLKKIGMNCGVEYTKFKLFKDIESYSRFEHSLGVALIIYHFTGDMKQSLAGLFHDISTPCFAHTVDFMHGDYIKQEATEDYTAYFIESSDEIINYLYKHNIKLEEVSDYHKYPIADNDGYKLSSDRLEYSLGNMLNYRFTDRETVKKIYDNLIVGINEFNEMELMFKDEEIAKIFFELSLKNSKVYICDEDRYSMQFLSDILKKAIELKTINYMDLYKDEEYLINKFINDNNLFPLWDSFINLSNVKAVKEYKAGYIQVLAKKRYINPYVFNKGRLSSFDGTVESKISEFLNIDFSMWLKGE